MFLLQKLETHNRIEKAAKNDKVKYSYNKSEGVRAPTISSEIGLSCFSGGMNC